MITAEQLKEIYPYAKDVDETVEALNKYLPIFAIDTPKRVAAFISQCGHESGGWRVFEENLNYSAKALNIVFPKYFKRAGRDAEEYHRQPEKIANVVYANRMGNGDTLSGEGWKYRGRGPIQITGKLNYRNFGSDMGYPSVSKPYILKDDKEAAIKSAIWFWVLNDLSLYADDNDIKGMTRRINGGYNGLKDRIEHYNKVLSVIDSDNDGIFDVDDENEPDEMHHKVFGMLRRGSRGEGVELVQELLGLTADGIFGKGTERAVKSWQESHGLVADGIVGPNTLDEMLD